MKLKLSKITVVLMDYGKSFLLACFGLLITFAISMGVAAVLARQTGIFAKLEVSDIQNDFSDMRSKSGVAQGSVTEGSLLNRSSVWEF